jgi:hypothetical protein
MKASRISLMVLSLAAAPAFAGNVDLSLTNDSVKGQVDFFGTNSDVQLGAGYTYHEDRVDILNVDFHAQGRTAIGNLPTTAGLGVRALAWDADSLDGGALALGGFATVNIPKVPGLSFSGAAHYAPSILSFGDSDSLTSLELRTSYRVIRNAEVFAGYRYLATDLDEPHSGNAHLDKGLLAGMRIFF